MKTAGPWCGLMEAEWDHQDFLDHLPLSLQSDVFFCPLGTDIELHHVKLVFRVSVIPFFFSGCGHDVYGMGERGHCQT